MTANKLDISLRIRDDIVSGTLRFGERITIDALASRYGVSLLRARQFFEPAIADPYEAEILGLQPGAPVLFLQNITYSQGDRPVVLSRAIMRGDRVRYLVELNQPITFA